MPESFNKKFIVDSTPPKLGVSHSPRLFSPDGDRDNDLLKIELSAKDDIRHKKLEYFNHCRFGHGI